MTRVGLWFPLLAIVAVAACKKPRDEGESAERRPMTADARAASRVPLGTVVAGEGIVEYAIYFLPKPKVPAAEAAKAVIARHPTLHLVSELTKDMPRPAAVILTPKIDTYAPPDPSRIELFGLGLSDAERAALPDSPEVLVLTFVSDGRDAVAVNGEAMQVVEEITAKTGGVIWDELSRQVFGAAAWHARAVQAGAAPPDLGGVITSHAYQPDGQTLARVISLGMDKIALPDLVIEDVPQSFETADDLLAAVAQLLVEGAIPDEQGGMTIELGAIRSRTAQQRFLAMAGPHPGAAAIELRVAQPKEGDGKNRLWEIGFLGSGSLQERQGAVLDAVFDLQDQVVGVAGDDAELRAASERARAALMKLKPGIAKGLAERERLIVKGPFAADGGDEYMWIEVSTWNGEKLQGVLLDEPAHVAGLKRGATVEVDEARVFDYKLTHADGSTEGGETNRILERR